MAPLGATFLKQRNAQKKTDEPSEGTEKRPGVEPTLGNEHFDHTTSIDDDEEDVAAVATSPSRASPSLYSTLKRVLEI